MQRHKTLYESASFSKCKKQKTLGDAIVHALEYKASESMSTS